MSKQKVLFIYLLISYSLFIFSSNNEAKQSDAKIISSETPKNIDSQHKNLVKQYQLKNVQRIEQNGAITRVHFLNGTFKDY